jgi:hypothetical protein
MNKISHPIEPEELMAYLDGELTADRAAATAAHLGECAACQGLVAELRGVSQNLKVWKVEPPESATPPTIATALAESRPEPNSVSPAQRKWREIFGPRWATVAWAGGVAAVLVVVGALEFQVRPRYITLERQVTSDSSANRDHLALRESPGPTSAGKPAETVLLIAPEEKEATTGHDLVANGPMIVRTAQISLITKEFDQARAQLEVIVKRHRGYVGELKVNDTTGSRRTLTVTLRIPADQLDATLTEVKTLGRVEAESQSGQDVTSQYVDLQARLSNARNTEQRLTDLLRNRTGKLSDVLEVEQELDRVRGEIEQMEAERKNMSNQVSYATLNATIAEDYKAQLQVVPPSTSTRLRNAAVEGYRSMADGVVSLALFLLSTGPSLLLWGVVLFFPARLIWKKVRRSFAS